MKFRQLLNNKGVTLVELLAALGLFGVITTLAFAAIFQLTANESKISENVTLKQDMNVLISELREQHAKGNELCINQRENRFIFNENGTNADITWNGKCVKDYDENTLLSIELTTTDTIEQDLTLKTTFTNTNDLVIEATNKEETYKIIENGKRAQCVYNKNTLFKNPNNNKKIMFQNNKCDDNTYVVKGSAWIAGDIEVKNKVKLKITKNLYIHDNVNIIGKGGNQDAGSLCVEGDIFFPDGKSKKDYNIGFKCEET